MLRDARRRSKHKAVPFDATVAMLDSLWRQQKGMCALSGVPMQVPHDGVAMRVRTAAYSVSLDRVNPQKGYTHGNMQMLLRCVNNAKSDMTEDQFIFMCMKVAQQSQDPRAVCTADGTRHTHN